jgi:hypothetical protein
MAGKVSGATGGNFGMKGGAHKTPTHMWEAYSEETGGQPGHKAPAGTMLKKELDKSRGTGLKVPT